MARSGRELVSPTRADWARDGREGRERRVWPLQLGQPMSVQPVSRICLRAPAGPAPAMPWMQAAGSAP